MTALPLTTLAERYQQALAQGELIADPAQAAAVHVLQQLQQQFYQLQFTLALPRLQPCAGSSNQQSGVSDRDYLQLLCALKIFAPEVSISISTRDRPALRNLLLTTIASTASAGSKTQPGGYLLEPQNLAQFDIEDNRSPTEIAQMLSQHGIAPVWQDWHPVLGRAAVAPMTAEAEAG